MRTPAATQPPGETAGRYRCAFVLGGGGYLGAHEVGMLRALLEAGIRPDLVVGTSVGALNGAVLAADPTPDAVERLVAVWAGLTGSAVFSGSVLQRTRTAVRSRTHLHSDTRLRALLERELHGRLIEDLAVPFQCVAAEVESAAEHWFTEGPVVEALLASCAVPGLLPAARIDGRHYLDGGLVNSIPVGRAVALGAREVFVLQVGRIEQPLRPAQRPWEVPLVAFEIARRHRFAHDVSNLPPGVDVHLLPSGAADERPPGPVSQLRYRDARRVAERIDRAHRASARYLAGLRPVQD
ncbi:patatin-like phospholipase family protein [Kitasatospora sp. NBC_01287]|uniref:patatin-like phospholipase family protein n=1 Tax=Kitasatospora sp. NBC_01287 TaxID=2903573 RepID=UPI00225912DC|nr:patatin-like phospholipase family protein [Kitasatospora sp. NBC_01287]MCX4744917.1 patatin-like phospholipase family protein [Kitasatospora sp. NBC_01287]